MLSLFEVISTRFSRSLMKPLLLTGALAALAGCVVAEPYPSAYYPDYPGGPYYYRPVPPVVVAPPPVGFFFGDFRGHGPYQGRGHFRHH
jgi:hypothetical protein